MTTTKIYITRGDSLEDLKAIKETLVKKGIEYSEHHDSGLISEHYVPIVVMDKRHFEGSRQLFNYLRHKNSEFFLA
jgi:hypothetical protein